MQVGTSDGAKLVPVYVAARNPTPSVHEFVFMAPPCDTPYPAPGAKDGKASIGVLGDGLAPQLLAAAGNRHPTNHVVHITRR